MERFLVAAFLVFIVFLSAACGRLSSIVGPTATPTQGQRVDDAIGIVQEQRANLESKMAALAREINATQYPMTQEVLSTKLGTYASYRQYVAQLEQLETRLELALATIAAKEALGEITDIEQVNKEIEILLKQVLEMEYVAPAAMEDLDQAQLLEEIALLTTSDPAISLSATPASDVLSDESAQQPVRRTGGLARWWASNPAHALALTIAVAVVVAVVILCVLDWYDLIPIYVLDVVSFGWIFIPIGIYISVRLVIVMIACGSSF